MKKFDIFKKFTWLKSPKHVVNMLLVALFALVFTGVLVSKYVFFQTIVGSDNNSKVTVVAPKNIEVVDAIKTEIRKREFAQKVKTVYAPADSVYIKNNLNEIISAVEQIRTSELAYKDKELMEFLGVDVKQREISLFGDDDIPSDVIVLSEREYAIKKNSNKDRGQRQFCGCMVSKDIGEYNTCPHLCEYCYANASKELAVRNWKQHKDNPFSETIIGR